MTTHRDDDLDRKLDRALDEIRGERPEAEFERAATARVWERLSEAQAQHAPRPVEAKRIASCGDFQGLLSDYLAGKLARARHLLLEDHLGECVPCRRALKKLRDAARPASTPERAPSRGWARTGWRLAAAAVVVLSLIGFSFKTNVFSFESGGLIRIEAVEGELFHITGDDAVPLKVGDVITLEDGDGVRTAKNSSAMLAMADESVVEMRERSQVAVRERRHLLPGRQPDGVVDLERGSIIVEASDQGSGHLYVDTQDCTVAVTGTVFSVSHGMKGSRVSVVEGEVHVNARGTASVLRPGDQTTTRAALNGIPVEQDIAWSRNSEEYVALLREMRALGRELDAVFQPELRYETDLLDIAPAGTVVYFAMPNMSDELSQAYELLQDRVSTSVVLNQWWEEQIQGSDNAEHIEQMIERIRSIGDHLGEEVVLTLQTGPSGDVDGPLFLARLSDPGSFARTFEDQIAEMERQFDEQLGIRLIEGPLSVMAPGDPGAEVYFWAQGDVLAMTPNHDMLWKLDAALQGHESATLNSSPFHAELGKLYDGGVEWVVGVDIQHLIQMDTKSHKGLDEMGLLDLEHLIGVRKQVDGWTDNRVELTFNQPRRRVASWLAEPAAMGAMEFISPDANLAVAFVMKDMGIVVDELFELIGVENENFEEELAEFQRETGIDVRQDLAYPLGGEFAMAIDGPLLPTPSWKVVAEVYDPQRLVRSVETLVDLINRETLKQDGQSAGLVLSSEELAGREYFHLQDGSWGLGVHFVFDGGYLLAGPSRGLLDRTLQNRAAGITLTDSAGFLDLLPHDGEVNFSGVVYQNMAPLLGPLSSTLETLGTFPDDQRAMIQAMASEARPGLALIYGFQERIVLTSSTEGGLFSSMMNQLSGATGLLSMQQSLAQAVHQGAAER